MRVTDADKLLMRLEQLRGRRSVVEETWRDCYKYTYPLRGVGFDMAGTAAGDTGSQAASVARNAQAELLDGTGTDGARILASGLQSGLTPSNSRWPGLEVGDESDEERRWLDEAADIIWEDIHASNYDAVGFDCMLDMSIAGMFPMFFDTDADGNYRFDQWPLANTFVACSKPGGPADIAFNEFPLSAEQALTDYGEEMVSEKVRDLAKDKPDEQVQFVRCAYPREGVVHGLLRQNMPFASVHIEKDTKKIVRESGYHESPLGVPRWMPIPGSAYAFGPAAEALPDMKTLNLATSYELANMDLATAGMWGAVDDGVLNPRSIKIGPRKVIIMAAKENFFPLQPAGDFNVALLNIERLQRQVRKIFMADQLEPQMKAGTPPTATEILVRVELIRQLLGPIYGRMQSEFMQWLVRRGFGLAYREGKLPPAPRTLMDPRRAIGVTYNSPIARAQKSTDVAAMDRYEGALGIQMQAGLTDAADVYNWDESRRHRAELLGVPAKLIPDEDEVEERRENRSKQQQAASAASLSAEVMLAEQKKP